MSIRTITEQYSTPVTKTRTVKESHTDSEGHTTTSTRTEQYTVEEIRTRSKTIEVPEPQPPQDVLMDEQALLQEQAMRSEEGLGEAEISAFGPQEVAAVQALDGELSVEGQIALDTRAHVLALSESGAGAAEIQAETLRFSIEQYAEQFPDMPPHELLDHAMANTAIVLNGSSVIEHLEQIGGNQQVVDYMRDLPSEAFAGGNLDTTNGEDLKPTFDDGTDNQAFHSNFFVTAGYINPNSWLAKAGNLKHELFDAGATVADYKASHIGLETGATLRAARDAAEADPERFELVASAPAVVGGVYGNDPTANAVYSLGGVDYDFTEAAQAASDYVDNRIDELDRHPAVWAVAAGQGLRSLFGLAP